MATITAANSEFVLRIPGVFSVDQPLEGYATDDAFDNEDVVPTEAKLGVDAIMSAGYTPYLFKQMIHLQADSDAIFVFDQWRQAMDTVREVFFASGTIILPAVGKIVTLTKGTLTRAKPLPDVKELLEAQTYEITWQSVSVAFE
jgi:hypothetical protein